MTAAPLARACAIASTRSLSKIPLFRTTRLTKKQTIDRTASSGTPSYVMPPSRLRCVAELLSTMPWARYRVGQEPNLLSCLHPILQGTLPTWASSPLRTLRHVTPDHAPATLRATPRVKELLEVGPSAFVYYREFYVVVLNRSHSMQRLRGSVRLVCARSSKPSEDNGPGVSSERRFWDGHPSCPARMEAALPRRYMTCCRHSRVRSSTGPGNLDSVDEIAIAYSDEPSKRAVLVAAALALVTDVVVTTQVHPALLRRVVRLAIPVVLTRPVAGILTRLGV